MNTKTSLMDLLFHSFMWDKTHHLDSVLKKTRGSDITKVHTGLLLHSLLLDQGRRIDSLQSLPSASSASSKSDLLIDHRMESEFRFLGWPCVPTPVHKVSAMSFSVCDHGRWPVASSLSAMLRRVKLAAICPTAGKFGASKRGVVEALPNRLLAP